MIRPEDKTGNPKVDGVNTLHLKVTTPRSEEPKPLVFCLALFANKEPNLKFKEIEIEMFKK